MLKKLRISLLALTAVLVPSMAFAQFRPPVNGNVTLTTSAIRLPSLETYTCTFQAPVGNTSPIYLGGSTVTNLGGANRGAALVAGATLNNISILNLNWMYAAGDTAGDIVTYLCN